MKVIDAITNNTNLFAFWEFSRFHAFKSNCDKEFVFRIRATKYFESFEDLIESLLLVFIERIDCITIFTLFGSDWATF